MKELPPTLLEMRNIHKWYGKVHAVDDVSFKINKGEIVGLLGDNGAGKSTLIKILSGYHHPTKGEIFYKEKKIRIKSPSVAFRLGIETVYQDHALVDLMSVARNFYMGREPVKWAGLLDKQKMNECMIPLRSLGLSIKSPDLLVINLSGGEKQGTAIGRAMHFKAKLLILDEPTRALGVKEVRRVLEFVKGLRKLNIAVIFITHSLHQIYAIADRFNILKNGKMVGEIKKDEVSLEELTGMVESD